VDGAVLAVPGLTLGSSAVGAGQAIMLGHRKLHGSSQSGLQCPGDEARNKQL